ncbi:MAG: DoxX family protein [Porticoccaceae bacterium]|nr:DoxX family protein [Porticoccaceae bacterium]
MILMRLIRLLKLPSSWVHLVLLIALSLLFINIGIDHFVNPDFYRNIMPAYLPMHTEAIYISGFFEILGGVAILFPKLRSMAGWGLVLLLIVVFPVNIHMAVNPNLFPDIPLSFLYIRLVLQFIIIYWTYFATQLSPQKDVLTLK